MAADNATSCLMTAWKQHEAELLSWLRRRLDSHAEADDILQNVFLKALRRSAFFCTVGNARAWLFEVTRNTLADHYRTTKPSILLPDDTPAIDVEHEVVDSLVDCLPRALAELPAADREAIALCDLEGMTQEAFAELKGLSIPGAKSRIQRARRRLRQHLATVCQIQFGDNGKVCCFTPRTNLQ